MHKCGEKSRDDPDGALVGSIRGKRYGGINEGGVYLFHLTELEQFLNSELEGRGSDSYPMISQPAPGGRIGNKPTSIVTKLPTVWHTA